MSELQKLVQRFSRQQERQQLEMERKNELPGKLENILGFPVSLTATVQDDFEQVWDFILRLEKGWKACDWQNASPRINLHWQICRPTRVSPILVRGQTMWMLSHPRLHHFKGRAMPLKVPQVLPPGMFMQ